MEFDTLEQTEILSRCYAMVVTMPQETRILHNIIRVNDSSIYFSPSLCVTTVISRHILVMLSNP